MIMHFAIIEQIRSAGTTGYGVTKLCSTWVEHNITQFTWRTKLNSFLFNDLQNRRDFVLITLRFELELDSFRHCI